MSINIWTKRFMLRPVSHCRREKKWGQVIYLQKEKKVCFVVKREINK